MQNGNATYVAIYAATRKRKGWTILWSKLCVCVSLGIQSSLCLVLLTVFGLRERSRYITLTARATPLWNTIVHPLFFVVPHNMVHPSFFVLLHIMVHTLFLGLASKHNRYICMYQSIKNILWSTAHKQRLYHFTRQHETAKDGPSYEANFVFGYCFALCWQSWQAWQNPGVPCQPLGPLSGLSACFSLCF